MKGVVAMSSFRVLCSVELAILVSQTLSALYYGPTQLCGNDDLNLMQYSLISPVLDCE
jgi:hypothetical protein